MMKKMTLFFCAFLLAISACKKENTAPATTNTTNTFHSRIQGVWVASELDTTLTWTFKGNDFTQRLSVIGKPDEEVSSKFRIEGNKLLLVDGSSSKEVATIEELGALTLIVTSSVNGRRQRVTFRKGFVNNNPSSNQPTNADISFDLEDIKILAEEDFLQEEGVIKENELGKFNTYTPTGIQFSFTEYNKQYTLEIPRSLIRRSIGDTSTTSSRSYESDKKVRKALRLTLKMKGKVDGWLSRVFDSNVKEEEKARLKYINYAFVKKGLQREVTLNAPFTSFKNEEKEESTYYLYLQNSNGYGRFEGNYSLSGFAGIEFNFYDRSGSKTVTLRIQIGL